MQRKIGKFSAYKAPVPKLAPAVRTITVVKPPRKLKQRIYTFSVQMFSNYVQNALSNTAFLLSLAISLFLIVNYHSDPTSSFVQKFLLRVHNVIPELSRFLCAHIEAFITFLSFLPVLYSVHSSKRGFLAILLGIYYALLPELSSYEYLVHSTLLMLFVRTPNPKFKIAIAAAGVLAYILQFTLPLKVTDTHLTCKAFEVPAPVNSVPLPLKTR